MILPMIDGEREWASPSPPFPVPPLSSSSRERGSGQYDGTDSYRNSGSSEEDLYGDAGTSTPFNRPRTHSNKFSHRLSSQASWRLPDIGEEEDVSLASTPTELSDLKENGDSTTGESQKNDDDDDIDNGNYDDAFIHGQRGSDDMAREGDDAPSAGGEEVPSAVLSNEAERILENAKKRLSVCSWFSPFFFFFF